MSSAILVHPSGDLNKSVLFSRVTLDQEINEMSIAPQPRKNLFRRTATTVYSAFNRAHGAVKKSESTATTVWCVADDDLSEDSNEDTIAATVSDLSCASTDGAIEVSHTVIAAVATDVSDEVKDTRRGSNAADTTTTALATTIVTAADDDCTDKDSKALIEGTAATEIECYQGYGHTPRNYGDAHYPRNFEQHVDKMDGSCSREEWAAARDEFDSIIEYPESSVGTPRRQVASEDHRQVLDIDKYATTMECKHQDAMVAMKSPRSIFDKKEFDTIEAALEGRSTVSQTKNGGEIEAHGRACPFLMTISEGNSLKSVPHS